MHSGSCNPYWFETATTEQFFPQACVGHSSWTAPEQQVAPAYVKPTACLDAANKAWTVVIGGLDKALCKAEMLEVMLDQADVAEHVKSCHVKKPRSTYEQTADISVKFSTSGAAKKCVRHFNGRQWGASGNILQARLAESSAGLARAGKPSPRLAQLEYGSREGSPGATQSQENVLEVPPGLASPASLDIAGVLPPPGLEAISLQAPPGLGVVHERDWNKRHSLAEDSTDAGTSVADDDPTEEEKQVIAGF